MLGALTCHQIGDMRLHPGVKHMPFAILIAAKEQASSREGARQSGHPTAVQTATDALLPKDGDIGAAKRRILRRDMRVALLPCLDSV